jgi:hypothetical protein
MKTADEILCEHGIKPPPGKFSDDFYTTCPHCSASRSPAHREANCLHVKVTKDGVVWFCNHCPWRNVQGQWPRSWPRGIYRRLLLP